MEKKFIQNIGFAVIAVGLMATPMDSVFAQQTREQAEAALNTCVNSFKYSVSQLTLDENIPFVASQGEAFKNSVTGALNQLDGCKKDIK